MEKKILNEVNRIKSIMGLYNDNNKIIVENKIIASLFRGAKTLAKRNLDDFGLTASDEAAKIIREISEATDESTLFRKINELGSVSDEVAKIFRGNLRAALPAETKNALNSIVNDMIKDGIDDINDIENYLDTVLNMTFENLDDNSRKLLKDMMSDSSDELEAARFMNKPIDWDETQVALQKTFSEMFNTNDIEEIQSLINNHYRNNGSSMPQWLNDLFRKFYDSRSDVQRALASKDGIASVIGVQDLSKMTKNQLYTKMSSALKTDKELAEKIAKDKSLHSFLTSPNLDKRLIEKTKTFLTINTLLAGLPFLWGLFFITWKGRNWALEKFRDFASRGETAMEGGIQKLDVSNEIKILKALEALNPDLIDELGKLKDGYNLDYGNGTKLVISNSEGEQVAEYTLDDINSKLIGND